jgi:hypothetical protein
MIVSPERQHEPGLRRFDGEGRDLYDIRRAGWPTISLEPPALPQVLAPQVPLVEAQPQIHRS